MKYIEGCNNNTCQQKQKIKLRVTIAMKTTCFVPRLGNGPLKQICAL